MAGDGEVGQGVLDIPLAIPERAGRKRRSACPRAHRLDAFGQQHPPRVCHVELHRRAGARAGHGPSQAMVLEIMGPPHNVSEKELGVAKLPNYGAKLSRPPRGCDTHAPRGGAGHRDGGLGQARERQGARLRARCTPQLPLVRRGRGRGHEGRTRQGARSTRSGCCADAGIDREPGARAARSSRGRCSSPRASPSTARYTAKAGAIEQSNFRDYRIARIHDAPRAIHVEVVASDEKSCGVGEPGVPPIAPAITNAVFALTGTRVRELPLLRSGLVS